MIFKSFQLCGSPIEAVLQIISENGAKKFPSWQTHYFPHVLYDKHSREFLEM